LKYDKQLKDDMPYHIIRKEVEKKEREWEVGKKKKKKVIENQTKKKKWKEIARLTRRKSSVCISIFTTFSQSLPLLLPLPNVLFFNLRSSK
jgi:hypothetical protein